MLYSLTSSIVPSKYFSQTKLRSRTRLFDRPNTPDDRTDSNSARSASSLLIGDCKRTHPFESVIQFQTYDRECNPTYKVSESHSKVILSFQVDRKTSQETISIKVPW